MCATRITNLPKIIWFTFLATLAPGVARSSGPPQQAASASHFRDYAAGRTTRLEIGDRALGVKIGLGRAARAGQHGGDKSVMARFSKLAGGVDQDLQDLPRLPARQEIAVVVGTMRQAVQHCYDLTMVPGRVEISLTVAGNSGRVISSSVVAQQRLADCIEQAASSLAFPRFRQGRAHIRYAYILR